MLAINYTLFANGEQLLFEEPSSKLLGEAFGVGLHIDNTVESHLHKHVACGTVGTNITHLAVKNPHHPDPTYSKTICETVVERASSSIIRLKINFKQLELYRPTTDGHCLHDKFAVYTDLNAPVTPIVCGNHTGKTISVPFLPSQTSLIISITTSDLDHDRNWHVEIEQE